MSLSTESIMNEFHDWLEGRADVAPASESDPRTLWLYVGDEEKANPAYAVLVPYGGQTDFVPVSDVSVQCKVSALDTDQAAELSSLLHGALFETAGQTRKPVRMVRMDSYVLLGVLDVGMPYPLNRDERGRVEWVFNFRLRAAPLQE